ncbi:DUF349 domain-containing protein [Lentisphaerota bacterium WC36G]|nr:DUF349 domain-containing protein [Lentisphaerae bacterium WC36]
MKAINSIINILKARGQNKLIEKINKLNGRKNADNAKLYEIITTDEREVVRIAALKKVSELLTLIKIEDQKLFTLENHPKEFNLLQQKIHQSKFKYCLLKNCEFKKAKDYLQQFSNKEKLELIIETASKPIAYAAFQITDDNEMRFKIFRKSSDKKLLQQLITLCEDNSMDVNLLQRVQKSAPNNRLQTLAKKRLDELKENDITATEEIKQKTVTKPFDNKNKEKIQKYESVIADLSTIKNELKDGISLEKISNYEQKLKDINITWQQLPVIPSEYEEVLTISFTKQKVKCQKLIASSVKYFTDKKYLLDKISEIVKKINYKLTDSKIENNDDFQLYQKRLYKLNNEVEKLAKSAQNYQNDKSVKNSINQVSELISNAQNRHKIIIDSITEQLNSLITETESMLDNLNNNQKIKERSNEILALISDKIITTNNKEHNSQINTLRRNLKHLKNHLINQYHSNDLKRWENYTEKLKLCEAMEKLKDITDMHEVSKKLKNYQAKWKKTGVVPADKNDEIWKRFQECGNELYQKCGVFFHNLKIKQEKAAELKEELIKQAEKLVETQNYTQTSKDFADLFEQWKKAGYVGNKEKEENLYAKFKELNDKFYQRKQKFFSERSKAFHDNEVAKKELISKAKQLLEQATKLDKRTVISSAQNFHKDWKKIGATKRTVEEVLYQEFNGYINKIFEKINGNKEENFQLKNAIIKKLQNIVEELNSNKQNIAKIDFSHFKSLREEFLNIGKCEEASEKEVHEKFSKISEMIFFASNKLFNTNFQQKEEIIKGLDQLYLEVQKNVNDIEIAKNIAAGAKKLQQKFQKLKLSKQNADSQEQWERFQNIGNNIFTVCHQTFAEDNDQREENYQQKLSLCLQLEQIVSTFNVAENVTDDSLLKKNAEDLALELTMAMTQKSNKSILNLKSAIAEVKNINNKWQQTGAVPSSKAEEIYSRYRTALTSFNAIKDKK